MKIDAVHGFPLILVVVVGLVIAISCKGGGAPEPKSDPEVVPADAALRDISSSIITPVQGPSWLQHLGIAQINQTSMGQVGGNEGPPESPRQEPDIIVSDGGGDGGMMGGGMMGGGMMNRGSSSQISPEELNDLISRTFILSGSDLYRLNCQSCHGAAGEGAPPEIKSLLGPVQGASPQFVLDRLKKIGRTISDSMAVQLADQAKQTVLDRLQKGGEKMPPFAHLQSEEIDALMQYLYTLAGYPESGEQILVRESAARVGEHLVKGTCHTCHGATGPGGRQMGMMSNVVSSLASILVNNSMTQDIQQVHNGSTGMMMGGQQMPALPFITQQEAAAEYLYLLAYPPEP